MFVSEGEECDESRQLPVAQRLERRGDSALEELSVFDNEVNTFCLFVLSSDLGQPLTQPQKTLKSGLLLNCLGEFPDS